MTGAGDGAPADGLPGLFGKERQDMIVELVRRDARASVSALADRLSVTVETIRRDLAVLERRGLLQRVHGGAIAVEHASFEPAIGARSLSMSAEKERIAKAAVHELPSEGSIFIEAGSTPGHLVPELPRRLELTVITNAPYLAVALAAWDNLTVICTGGRVRQRTLACIDYYALRHLAELHVDVAFLGTNGVSATRGLTTPDHSEAAVKRATLGLADRTILLADHSKVGLVSVCQYGRVDDVDLVITDSGVTDELAEELRGAGTELMRV